MKQTVLVLFRTKNDLGTTLSKVKIHDIFNCWVGLLDIANLGNHWKIDKQIRGTMGHALWTMYLSSPPNPYDPGPPKPGQNGRSNSNPVANE